MKNKYEGSLHDLATNVDEFEIKDCSGIYKVKRINEFMDCTLQVKRDHVWECAGIITVTRTSEINVSKRTDGITFTKRVKLNDIKVTKRK